MNGRKKRILSLPANLLALEDTTELHREIIRCAVSEGVIQAEGEVGRVVIVPHRHIANIVTR